MTGIVHADDMPLRTSDPGVVSSPPALDDLLAIKIYRVHNGKMASRTFYRDSIKSETFSIPGYISGIVVVGKPGLSVKVAGKPMSPVDPGTDGEFSLGYYGRINPAQMLRSDKNETNRLAEPAIYKEGKRQESKPKVYSYFPLVPADTINKKSNFLVEISSGKSSPHQLHFSHSGVVDQDLSGSERKYHFQYAGFKKKELATGIKGMDERRMAISDGIAAVESYFKINLVNRVNFINYDGIYNAVTYLNQDDIWFYINILKDEPLEELTVIAQHETLHILVDKLNLTSNTNIRKIFADLKGFHDFSIERYQVVSRGHTPSDARMQTGEDGAFFEFISERNYLNNMKGGHPQGNLDEFCTSFLHTLMYPERFEANLKKGGSLHITDKQTREMILDRYISMLKEVRKALMTDAASNTDFQMVSNQFLQQLDILEAVNQSIAKAPSGSN